MQEGFAMHKTALVAAKFGGTSVRDAERILNVRDIVRADSRRRFIVVSAPAGVTNELIRWLDAAEDEQKRIWKSLIVRFEDIVTRLGIDTDIGHLFNGIEKRIHELKARGQDVWLRHFVRSRGEWINAQIVAATLGFEFLDASDLIVFQKNQKYSANRTLRRAGRVRLRDKHAHGVVIPGFYGAVAGRKNTVCTFTRGGSDITGAIVALLIGAEVYENWTDVEGVFAADPRIIPNPHKNEMMTYKELRELTFMGAKVFHEDAVAIVRSANIPIHVRCTTTPEKPGTMIVAKLPDGIQRPTVTGVAGKNGFTQVVMEKYGMDDEIGILSRAANVFTRARIGLNVSSSIDSLTFIVETAAFRSVRDRILTELRGKFQPDDVRVEDDIALMCTVGEGMRGRPGTSAKLDTALADANINIVLELQGGSQINIIRGVKEADLSRAIRASYDAFFK